ncbi:2-oxoglutarate-dependent dioxygenase tropC [Dendrobium catenatum]|uniref:Gibberellin 3-beta-dioxygenase 3 n=1 Tax=Dendrobium catenatum TaxID=906689 RepID=A0A2I0WZL6_9ASPA|nr:2-oxoglutarate-dependent dioxygenase tropC [Dendrobium catenatum]PKU81093.1 Gibberellin 3-beta-dioxygenase 3 [Dendrobium catenatum]
MGAPGSGADTSAKSNVTALNCISLSDPDIQKSISLLRQACLDSGFFYVIDHGISQEFMDEVFFRSRKFFELPLHKKMELFRNEKLRGYTPTADQTLDPKNQVQGSFPNLMASA